MSEKKFKLKKEVDSGVTVDNMDSLLSLRRVSFFNLITDLVLDLRLSRSRSHRITPVS